MGNKCVKAATCIKCVRIVKGKKGANELEYLTVTCLVMVVSCVSIDRGVSVKGC